MYNIYVKRSELIFRMALYKIINCHYYSYGDLLVTGETRNLSCVYLKKKFKHMSSVGTHKSFYNK